MSANVESVKKLRKISGAGFKDCNTAIEEANGDLEKAVEILRVKGISKASKKMTRDAKEGLIAITEDKNLSSILEINCETDFVAKNEEFINFAKELSNLNLKCQSNPSTLKKEIMKNGSSVDENLVNFISKIGEKITLGRSKFFNSKNGKIFSYLHTVVKDNLAKLGVIVILETKDTSEKINDFGKKLAMHIAALNPLSLDINSIDSNILSKEEELINEELKNSGKPDEIVKKIAKGKLIKFKEENSLLSQQWVIEPKKKVSDIIKELKISDLKIKEFIRLKIGE